MKNRQRARNNLGHFIPDNKQTTVFNEAYVYTRWEKFKWNVFFIRPENSLWDSIKSFFKFVFMPHA
jgi:hypothetical protein